MEITIPISSIWSFLSWLPKFVLRKKFPESRMAKLIYADLRPRHQPVTINCGQDSYLMIWLQLINLTPFSVTLDRANLRFQCGQTWNTPYLERIQIKSGASATVLIRQDIQVDPATSLKQQISNGTCCLNGSLQFDCKLHSFTKPLTLDGIIPHFMNC